MTALDIKEAHQQFQDGAITAVELANCSLAYAIDAEDLMKFKPEVIELKAKLENIIVRWMIG